MANGDVFFPKIAIGNWWKLRDLFKRKVPSILTPTYLASALSMEESSAKSNIIVPFRKIGIIDDEGKPTDLAYDWRDDDKYADVCSKIIEANYPEELRDLFHSSDADYAQVQKAFMRHARCGEAAARMFSKFYILLLEADPKGADSVVSKQESKPVVNSVKTKPASKSKPATQVVANQVPEAAQVSHASSAVQSASFANSPELHINIQLHISPESSAEQIDKIFESMAKHLKHFNK